MKTWALITDTWREAFARFTFLGFAIASTLFLLTLAFALNLDIVDGSLAAASLLGKEFVLPEGGPPIDQVVVRGQAVFAGMLYGLGIFLAVFATGSLVPNLVKRGTVDLYLTRPISRTQVLLGRFAGGVTLVIANLAYLCGGVVAVVTLKTGVWNPRFLLAGGVILLVFLSFLGLMFLVGVLSGSTPLSIMVPYGLYVISLPLAAHERLAAVMDSRLAAGVVHTLYWVLPKTAELGRDMVRLVLAEGSLDPIAAATTAAFGAICLTFALIVFNRKNY
jgi:ABC-type transport system involved in multi-copper enzyme maturation permease subunit